MEKYIMGACSGWMAGNFCLNLLGDISKSEVKIIKSKNVKKWFVLGKISKRVAFTWKLLAECFLKKFEKFWKM